MNYFEQFTSNTYAGSSNQLYFNMKEGEVRTGRIFYKISTGGEYNYSLLFSNIIDSTFADGSVSHNNLICDEWKIHSFKIAKCTVFAEDINVMPEVTDFKEVTFDGKSEKNVMPGEFFATDPIRLDFNKGEYLCMEITYSGKMIPYHEETLLPVYVKENGEWKYSKQVPFASMIGCDRKVKAKIAYFGDSITQGLGTQINSYLHWNANLSRKIGDDYAYWNLGIGYGRASDAASDGAWLYKARQNDIVFVCYGVNDILQGRTANQVKDDLTYIVENLKNAGKKVFLLTVPPFDYLEEATKKWNEVNDYIKTVLKYKVDFLFDNVSYLGESEELSHMAKYGGHPNEEGCRIWADALYEEVKKFF